MYPILCTVLGGMRKRGNETKAHYFFSIFSEGRNGIKKFFSFHLSKIVDLRNIQWSR